MHDAKRIRSLIAEEVDSLIAFRRELHQHPEIGYQEHETARRIQRELAATFGVNPKFIWVRMERYGLLPGKGQG